MSRNYFASMSAEQLGNSLREELFINTMNIMPAGVQVLKALYNGGKQVSDYTVVFSNKAAFSASGDVNDGEQLGNTAYGKRGLLNILLDKANAENKTSAFLHPYNNVGKLLNYTVTALADGILLTHEDPSAQRLQEEAQLIHSLTLSTPDILFVMNLFTKEVVYINRSIEKLLGFTHEEIEKMEAPFFDMIHPDDLSIVLNHLEEMKDAALNETREITYRLIDAKSNVRWFRDRNTVFKVNEGGKATEKTGVLSDITQHRDAEDKIRDLNKTLTAKNRELESVNSEMKTFSNIAANEYKETLQNLYTNLEFILTKDAGNLSNTGKGNLRKMQAAIQKMKLMTDDIVSFSKIQTLDDVPANVNLNNILREIKEDLTDKITEKQSQIITDELPDISGFPLLLSLLFYHLLDNAVKFGDGKPIHIRYSKENADDRSSAGLSQSYHKISFSNDGEGFSGGDGEKLFTMFYRMGEKKKFKGSGVGLAICKKIMDLHNGFIIAESTGEGAVFSCFFPF